MPKTTRPTLPCVLSFLAAACLCGCGRAGERQFNEGASLVGKQQWDRAAEAFERALKANPNLVEAHFALGKAYFSLGKHEEAVAKYERGLELQPHNPHGQLSLGLACFELKRYKDALRAFHKAMLMDDNFAPAIYGMGRAYWAMAKDSQDAEQRSKYTTFALMYLFQAVEQQPDYFLAHELMGEIYESLAKAGTQDQRVAALEQAVKYYNQAAALHGGNQGILLTLIRLYSTLGDFKRVKELVGHITILAKVTETKVPPIVLAYKARSEEEHGDYGSAVNNLKQFIQEQEQLPTEGLSEEEKEARTRQLKEAQEAKERCRRKQTQQKPPAPPVQERKEEPPPPAP